MKIVAQNKKAFHDYEILETIEAGVVLTGDEVKSIRAGHVSLNETFATVKDSELFLLNCHIAPYSHAYTKADQSRRTRKLLLSRKEINKLVGAMSRRGLTLIPLKMYFNERSYIKIELGLAKHKSAQNKRRELRERDIKRETERDIKMRIT